MEILIELDGKLVPFKSTGGVPKRYMAQFGRDLLKDMLGMGINIIDLENSTEQEQLEWMRENIDFNIFYDIAWTFAKTANPSIPEPLTWLDTFETFPIYEMMNQIQDLLNETFTPKKKLQAVAMEAQQK